ncbi:MAG TPA: caspase family protein [Steroidobacteraceae bacterium]|jgi:uncharacterized caspase-like protein|nr:caspase family protein [Steroidobacteraceae bacterium]
MLTHTNPARRAGLALIAVTVLAVVSPAQAKRLALVIGNDSYQHADPLGNARADARAVADTLRATNFKVTLKQDVGLQAMKEAIRTFKNEVAGGDEVIFYYAGHGVQLEGNNYMIPVDTAGDSPDQLKDDSVSLQRVLDDMQDQKARFTLAIIDACRDNPFKGNGRALRARGLAPVTAADGQAVLYSAGAGQEALDNLGPRDKDPNGVFTRVLIKEMKTPGLSFDQVIHDVRDQVVQLAKSVEHVQTPGYYSQFTGDFYFIAPGAGQTPAHTPVGPAASAAGHGPTADEIAAFRAAEAANSVAGWQIFKRNYPNSAYATTADIRLASLTPPHVAAPAPSATSPASQPARPARSDIDPVVVGNFEADSVVDDYDTHVSYSITADGKYRLVTTQEESGTYRSAFGIYRTTAGKTHRVRTGTFRAVGTTAIEVTGTSGSAVFQPVQPGAPVNPLQPVMLGTWHATFLQGGLSWALTIQNNPDGTYHFRTQAEDSGTYSAANNQWRTTSAVTGQSNTGTYRAIDARNVEFTGSAGTTVWKRQ